MNVIKATAPVAQLCLDIRREAIVKGCHGFYPDADLAVWVSVELESWFVDLVERHFYQGG
ncbi:MAG: hypothetical protein LPD71_15700 [Shewanella sp.]|nr:hypothetical protein [Shewanella sp.]MCF1430407.1 hypothetical protein [Shewanella sp.]MCF1440113.1 hypothetical protein [Shewanella sp.]